MVISLEEARKVLPFVAINTLKKQYQAESPNPSSEATINFASGLIRSSLPRDKELGIQLLHELLLKAPALQNDLKYMLALGYFNLGQYTESKALADKLLASPHAREAEKLIHAIDEQVKKEGLIGLGIVGGAAVVVGAVIVGIASLFKK